MGKDTSSINAIAEFDIIKFAKDILGEVNAIRSVSKITDEKTKSQYQWPIESRLNAFCRLIGLPMFVSIEKKNKDNKQATPGDLSGKRHLTPGYYGKKLANYNVQNDTKTGVLVQNREEILKTREEKVGKGEMDDDMLKALKSAMPLTTTYPYPRPDISSILQESTIGKGTKFERKVYKNLFPLVTSYLEVQPVKNEIARPFLQLMRNQMPDNSTVLPKPFIETVIRIRMISAVGALDVNALNKITETVRGFTTNIGTEEYTELANEIESVINTKNKINVLEGLIISKLISSIEQIAKIWVVLQNTQEKYFTKSDFVISVKTDSSKFSTFGKRADTSPNLAINPKCKLGLKLQNLKVQQTLEEAKLSLLPSEDSVYGTNSRTSQTKNTLKMSLVTPFINMLSYNLDKIKKEIQKTENDIKKWLNGTEKLRVELEAMTGEFTGLSVPDVIAVIIALFIIDEKYLIALLDTEVKEEMKKDTRLKDAIESVGNPDGLEKAKEATDALEIATQFVFDLLNTSIQAVSDKMQRSKEARSRKRKSKTSRRSPYGG